jgi:hypothetical protein
MATCLTARNVDNIKIADAEKIQTHFVLYAKGKVSQANTIRIARVFELVETLQLPFCTTNNTGLLDFDSSACINLHFALRRADFRQRGSAR